MGTEQYSEGTLLRKPIVPKVH